ncbi:cuticle protein 1-like [Amyelois transitella]|uniref:cuticle protein 1-like n=1 Tax=Amyelois transitella TaxID=680683 RepID=UPI0029903305|nr:cuticle protein 1-like [Amyelois transitella]
MYAKLFIVLALAAAALSREYPAGVHPAVCPNYPYCDTSALARHTPDGQPIPEWVYNPSILPVAPVDPNHAAAPRYPADFNPALCPNYPYCW